LDRVIPCTHYTGPYLAPSHNLWIFAAVHEKGLTFV
jgi:hypothetical protein